MKERNIIRPNRQASGNGDICTLSTAIISVAASLSTDTRINRMGGICQSSAMVTTKMNKRKWIVDAIRYNAYERSRWNIMRDILMPSMMGDKPGESSTMSDAERAASVLPCTAIPTLA